MSEPVSTDSYKGVRDFYPSDWAKMEAIFNRIRETLREWGYEEYNASPLERAELYEAKTSEEIVNEQTYTFTDRGDRRVTLRPEMTPTLARMVSAHRRDLTLPLRWFSIGNRFRYERPQRGRLREFYQVDVDLVGLPEGEADNEIICLTSAILKKLGASTDDFVIRINSRGLIDAACKAAGLDENTTRQYIRLLDKRAKMTPEDFKSASSAICTEDPLALIETASTESEVGREKDILFNRIETLKGRGIENVVYDSGITRGFDYYTGMVFEVFDTNPENPRSMFGGGRYDELMSLFGTEQIPAVGFAIGDVTLSDFLNTHNIEVKVTDTTQLYLGTPSTQDIDSAQSLAEALRAKGARVFVNITNKSLGDQVKDAVRRGIPYFAAYGKDERSSGSLRLKKLDTGTEDTVTLSELDTRLHLY